jgi:hypothetical protein
MSIAIIENTVATADKILKKVWIGYTKLYRKDKVVVFS